MGEDRAQHDDGSEADQPFAREGACEFAVVVAPQRFDAFSEWIHVRSASSV